MEIKLGKGPTKYSILFNPVYEINPFRGVNEINISSENTHRNSNLQKHKQMKSMVPYTTK